MIRGDHQRRSGHQPLDDSRNESIDIGELRVVVRTEPAFMSHLVDAVVIGVDEWRTALQQLTDLHRKTGRHSPTERFAATQMGFRESGSFQLGLTENRH